LSFGTSDISRLEGVFCEIVSTEVEPVRQHLACVPIRATRSSPRSSKRW
jgi:hypothetical protein